MKKNFTFFCATALMSALSAGFVACNDPKDPELQGEDVPFTEYSLVGEGTPSEEISGLLIDPKHFITPHDEGKAVIVNSDEELKNYLWDDFQFGSPYPYPPIDFSTKTLLLVGGLAYANVYYSAISSFQYFPSGKYKLDVELSYTATMAWSPNWYISILTDKMSGNSKIEVNITEVSKIITL